MLKAWLKVHPEGIEPSSQEPESCILSIELQVLISFFTLVTLIHILSSQIVLSQSNSKYSLASESDTLFTKLRGHFPNARAKV